MIKKTKLTRAVSLAITGTVLSLGAATNASADVMYNTYNAHAAYTATDAGAGGTDGWVWGGIGATSGGSSTAASGWVGTGGPGGVSTTTPFGYIGAPHLNWGARLGSAGGSLEVSQQHAFDTYGLYADIDTAAGAWLDTEASPQGWKHNTDIGLFKSDVTQNVHLNLSTINSDFANFGITVFEGQATNITGYSHHGTWNNGPDKTPFLPIGTANPFGTTGLETVVGWDETVDSANEFTFLAQAGQVYSIYLGGSGGIHWNQVHDGYVLNITSSPVPVPAAAWLMGSGLLGLIGMRRKKQVV